VKPNSSSLQNSFIFITKKKKYASSFYPTFYWVFGWLLPSLSPVRHFQELENKFAGIGMENTKN